MSAVPENIAYCHACGAPMDVSALAPFSNAECPQCAKHTRVKREFGPYTLVRRHAIGGMSMVFIAHDNTLDREVALKILSEEFSADERRIAAFEEEARITASFSHPNVVRVLTTGYAFGRFYIAMELVPGGHFEHQIRERGKIPELEMLPLAIEVAHGLKAAHSAGLIHRDVKPGNILLDAEGHAKLVDFGLALVTKGGKARATELWATPYYVPPETVEGYEEDFRSDIYAFGATLYHALAGKPSCGEESMATDVLRNAKKRVVPISAVEPSISTETCAIIERAMAYQPDERFSSYDELIASLAVALSHLKSGRSEFAGTAAKRRAVKKRREFSVLAGGIIAVALMVIAIVWALNRMKSAPIVETPPIIDTVPPPVEDKKSAEIGKSYRAAREAMNARDFAKAAGEFTLLHQNPSVEEPTRSWTGVEAVLALYLDGRPADARKQARLAIDHIREVRGEGHHIGGRVTAVLADLGEWKTMPAPKPDADDNGASQMISSMLAGLKSWEQGLLDPAAAFFQAAADTQLPPNDDWASIYQKITADYLADHAILTGPLFAKLPTDAAACQVAITELDRALDSLKTRGRARFNLRAWQLDLVRHASLLNAPKPAPDADAFPDTPPKGPPELAEVMAKLDEFTAEGRFADAIAYLESIPADPKGASKESLLSIAESASVFLADLQQDLAKGTVTLDLPLKSGETMSRIAIANGDLMATSTDGQTRTCKWSDFSPDALIALHRLFVRNPADEIEKLRRHECAIAYDWLSGNRARARGAAAVLAESSDAFRQRWIDISSGLPN